MEREGWKIGAKRRLKTITAQERQEIAHWIEVMLWRRILEAF